MGTVLASAPEFIVIVARDHAELLPRVRRQFLDDARVQVIVDRRRSEGRHRAETPSAERRRATDYWEDLRHHPVVLVPVVRRPPTSPSPSSPTSGGRMEATKSATRVTEFEIDRLCDWTDAGREVLGRLALLLDSLEGLRGRADDAEREARELRRALEERTSELGQAQAEVERLTRDRVALAEAARKALRKLEQLGVLGRPPAA